MMIVTESSHLEARTDRMFKASKKGEVEENSCKSEVS